MALKFTHYKQSCPHCGSSLYNYQGLGSGYTLPEAIGNPYRECPNCHEVFFDRNVKEYAALIFHMFDDHSPHYDKTLVEKMGNPLKKIVEDPLYIFEFSEFQNEHMASKNIFNEKANGLLNNPHALAESYLRLNNFDHAKKLYDLDHDIPIMFLKEVYFCPNCKKLVGRETRGERYCSSCNTRLIPSGVHVYEWNFYSSEKRAEIKKSLGWDV